MEGYHPNDAEAGVNAPSFRPKLYASTHAERRKKGTFALTKKIRAEAAANANVSAGSEEVIILLFSEVDDSQKILNPPFHV